MKKTGIILAIIVPLLLAGGCATHGNHHNPAAHAAGHDDWKPITDPWSDRNPAAAGRDGEDCAKRARETASEGGGLDQQTRREQYRRRYINCMADRGHAVIN